MQRIFIGVLGLALTGFSTMPGAWAAENNSASAGSTWLRVDGSRSEVARRLSLPVDSIDYGRFQWLRGSVEEAERLRDSGLTVTVMDHAFDLDLGGERFDPLSRSPSKATTSTEADWQLVQFRGPIRPAWLDGLRGAGLIPVQYIHPYTWLVWSTPAARDRAATLDGVRWSGAFETTFRIRPEQRQGDAGLRAATALISRHADRNRVLDELRALGAEVESVSALDSHLEIVGLRAPGNRFEALAATPGVYTLQAIAGGGGPRSEMSPQSIVGAYGPAPNYTIVPGYPAWLATLGFNGSNVIVSVVDGGFRSSHLDLATHLSACVPSGDTPTSCTTFNDNHGTHVAAAIAGNAGSGMMLNGFRRGQGVAPGALLVQQRYDDFLGAGPGQMISDGMLKIYRESALSGAVLTNNSWGPTGSPQGYDIPTQQVDMVIRDADPQTAGNQQVQNVWSIMNGGGDGFGACAPSSLGSPDEAKNLFAVGSTPLQVGGGAQVSNIFDVSSNSAHGNACDGRRVPHIVAPGCSTDSASGSGNSSYMFMCGTSMASPVVTGAAAVFVEKYRAEHEGATPSPAMIKAAFTAVAMDLNGFHNADGGTLGHRPDRFQGYGRIDLAAAVAGGDPVYYLDQTEVLGETGAEWSTLLQAADPARPVRVMLAWTDAKGHGLGGTTPAWVNNLDLSLATTTQTFLGNVIGADGWSSTGGSADEKNNLEGIFLPGGALSEPFTLKVLGANIAADALNPYVPGAPAQDFAIACYNCEAATLGTADLGLSLASNPFLATAGAQLDLVATLANAGSDAVNGAELRLTLPPTLSFVSAGLSSGAGTWSCQFNTPEVVCTQTAGSLPVDPASSVLTVTTTVDPGIEDGASIDVAGSVQASLFTDANPADNEASLSVHVGDLIFADGFETLP